MTEPTIVAIPFFLASLAIEAFVLFRQGHGYEGKDTAASLSGGLGSLVVKGALKAVWFGLFAWLYQYRFFDLGMGALAWLLIIPAEDFCYYWYHRVSHEVRFFWAGHVVHHSSRRYTLATALRQSWTAPVLGMVFWMPLPLLGFRPEMVALMSSFSLLYQYWIHTETIGKLGPLEWVMNTPSHHRVHHGSNPQYIDRNHAGIFIVWDRLFGTFEPEVEKVVYGLTKDVGTYNPVTLQFGEFGDLVRDVRSARSASEALHSIFGNPASVGKARGATPAAAELRPGFRRYRASLSRLHKPSSKAKYASVSGRVSGP